MRNNNRKNRRQGRKNPQWWDDLAYGNGNASNLIPIPHNFEDVKTVLWIIVVFGLIEWLF